jgi:hypothetical protein
MIFSILFSFSDDPRLEQEGLFLWMEAAGVLGSVSETTPGISP